ncbi:cytochrome c [uncultured Marixanthomonas sp.]|uniref:c-type cytochrome n=1 Tax=uncultured Marixanthomonas sp. TaxID=757245 RepID=UPI0030DB7280|tara:strand:+ start:56468 stop:56929 length:462 start_codon:yes stop_codon:yes gene_type:complete
MQKIAVILFTLFFLTACNNSKKEKKEALKIGDYTAESSQKDQTSQQSSKERGALIYTDFCMQCHLGNGKGVPNTFPPLAGSNWLSDKREESIHAVKFGQRGEIEVNGKKYDGVMVPMGLSDKEVADVLNYVMTSWGNTQEKPVTEEEVANIKK